MSSIESAADVPTNNPRLTEQEQARVDLLLATARRFHSLAFVVAGISCALSAGDLAADFKLPLGDLKIPASTATVLAFLLTICLVAVSDRLYRMSAPWLSLDPRRPPFPWFVLCSGGKSYRATSIIILLPLVPAALAAGIVLRHDATGLGLLWMGVFLAWFLRELEFSAHFLLSRQDERGGAATFSIWLLYCYRLARSAVTNLLFLSGLLAAVPSWRPLMSRVAGFAVAVVAFLFVARLIGAHLYHHIDIIGVRLGFPAASPHYSPGKVKV